MHLAERLAESLRAGTSPADLRARLLQHLAPLLEQLHIPPAETAEPNLLLLQGRTGAVYSALAILLLKPGRLAQKRGRTEAIRILQRNLPASGVGVAIDGQAMCRVHPAPPERAPVQVSFLHMLDYEDGQAPIISLQMMPVEAICPQSATILLYTIRALTRAPFTPSKIAERFGAKSPVATTVIAALQRTLLDLAERHESPPAYTAWQTLFATLYGMETRDSAAVRALGSLYHAGDVTDLKLLLFAVQTYYALLLTLLAVEVCGCVSGTMIDLPTALRFDCDDTELREGLALVTRRLEEALPGFGAGAEVYTWYLDAWTSEMADAVRALLTTLGSLEPATLLLQPWQTRDLLKPLYHDLLPQRLRHELGEYYTPDWLADLVLNRLEYRGNARLLDPACGSGTFLVEAIRRVREAYRNPARGELLQAILDHVAGFDLNPLAVLAARTNYLLAIADLLEPDVPVHLPVEQRDALVETAANARYDVIAGNPPWINWESLPPASRAATRDLWIRYGLFSLNGTQARLGGGKKDLAMLFTYHCAEQYLQPGGKLGFVVPQSCFKSKSSGAGFRKFPNLRVLHIEDLSEIQPFQATANRTAVLLLQRGNATVYPVPYILWRKLYTEAENGAVDPNATLDQVQQMTYRARLCATPLWESEPGAPWLTVRPAAIRALRRVIGQSPYRAYEGVNTGGLNGIYWLNIQERTADGLLHVENLWDAGRRKVRRVARTIEPDLVFPLLRGRDVSRWHAAPSAAILLPQDPQRRRGYDEEWLAAELPQTYAFLKQFEQELRTERQSSMIQNMVKKGPFYSMYGVAEHTFAPNKVVWREQASTLTAAVVSTVDEQIVVPDHKLMLVALRDENEAHYLCACLSSSIVQLLARAVFLQTSTSTGLLDHIAIPQYDPSNPLHHRLSGISWQAHMLAQEDNSAGLATLHSDLDSAAAQLWGLSDDELVYIHRSLCELLGEILPELDADEGFPL